MEIIVGDQPYFKLSVKRGEGNTSWPPIYTIQEASGSRHYFQLTTKEAIELANGILAMAESWRRTL